MENCTTKIQTKNDEFQAFPFNTGDVKVQNYSRSVRLRQKKRFDYAQKFRLLDPNSEIHHSDLSELKIHAISLLTEISNWSPEVQAVIHSLNKALKQPDNPSLDEIKDPVIITVLFPLLNPTTPTTILNEILEILLNLAYFSNDLVNTIVSWNGFDSLIGLLKTKDIRTMELWIWTLYNICNTEANARAALDGGLLQVMEEICPSVRSIADRQAFLMLTHDIMREVYETNIKQMHNLVEMVERVSLVTPILIEGTLKILHFIAKWGLPHFITPNLQTLLINCLDPGRCQAEHLTLTCKILCRVVRSVKNELFNVFSSDLLVDTLEKHLEVYNGRTQIAVFRLITELLESENVVLALPIDSSIVQSAVNSLLDWHLKIRLAGSECLASIARKLRDDEISAFLDTQVLGTIRRSIELNITPEILDNMHDICEALLSLGNHYDIIEKFEQIDLDWALYGLDEGTWEQQARWRELMEKYIT